MTLPFARFTETRHPLTLVCRVCDDRVTAVTVPYDDALLLECGCDDEEYLDPSDLPAYLA